MSFYRLRETTLENVSEEEVTNLFGQTESTEQVQRLEVALEQLLPDERALILLFYWKEKNNRRTGLYHRLDRLEY